VNTQFLNRRHPCRSVNSVVSLAVLKIILLAERMELIVL